MPARTRYSPAPHLTGVAGSHQWQTRFAIKTLSTGAIVLGVAMVLGGASRFGSPALAAARTVPGAQNTWGALLVAVGLLTFAGVVADWWRSVVMVGLAAQTTLHLFFAAGLVRSAISDPHAAVTGAVTYTMVAVLCASAWATGHDLGGRSG